MPYQSYETTKTDKHSHVATVNSETGDGRTLFTNEHYHSVENWVAVEQTTLDKNLGHSHKVKKQSKGK